MQINRLIIPALIKMPVTPKIILIINPAHARILNNLTLKSRCFPKSIFISLERNTNIP